MSIQRMTVTASIVNGIDTDRLSGTIDAIAVAPALAKFTFRASNHWIRGGHNRTTIQGYWGAGAYNERNGFVIDNAETQLMLGGDEAPHPLEYVLHALVGCLTTTLVYCATRKTIQVRSLASRIEGDIDLRGMLGLDGGIRCGFREIRVQMRVDADCSESDLRELMQLVQSNSAVFDVVSRGVPVALACEAVRPEAQASSSSVQSLPRNAAASGKP